MNGDQGRLQSSPHDQGAEQQGGEGGVTCTTLNRSATMSQSGAFLLPRSVPWTSLRPELMIEHKLADKLSSLASSCYECHSWIAKDKVQSISLQTAQAVHGSMLRPPDFLHQRMHFHNTCFSLYMSGDIPLTMTISEHLMSGRFCKQAQDSSR